MNSIVSAYIPYTIFATIAADTYLGNFHTYQYTPT